MHRFPATPSTPPPLQEIDDFTLCSRGVRLLVHRADLIHPAVSGNKWHKLRYNIETARERGHDTVLSFGGAYSNHIHALAAAAQSAGLKSIGVIRGELAAKLNPMLRAATAQGMTLHPMSRSRYRDKESAQTIEELRALFGDFFLIPEGGSNALGVRGCAEWIASIDARFDIACCPVGSGGTLAGVIAGLAGHRRALGVGVLKGEAHLQERVARLVQEYCGRAYSNWHIAPDYHHGGYAKFSPELLAFTRRFSARHDIPLEPIYTGKLFFALHDLVERDYFVPGTTLLALHTGGLQGLAGLRERAMAVM